jgi:hypothetical protein
MYIYRERERERAREKGWFESWGKLPRKRESHK